MVLVTLLLLSIVCGSYLYLARVGDLRLVVAELVFVSAVIVCVLTLVCYLGDICAVPAAISIGKQRRIFYVLMLLALVVRLLFLLRPAELSDDVYRYLWDGLQLLHGHNPYALAPQNALVTDSARLLVQPLINHPQLVTIYPPAAQLLFAASGGTLLGWKLLLCVLDLGSCVVLAKLLVYLGRSPWWLSIYALHPLVVLEGAASAHVDVAALFFVLLSLWLAVTSNTPSVQRSRVLSLLAAVCLAVAVMIKLFPMLFVPFFYLLLLPQQRRIFAVVFGLSCVALVVPFLPQIVNATATLQLYVSNWEFSSCVFRWLRSLVNSGTESRLILLLVFVLVVASSWWKLYRREANLSSMVHSCISILLLFLLLTPTLHPWYALYLVAFLPLAATPATIAISWSVLLSYQVVAAYQLSGVWLESSLLSFYIFLAPVVASLLMGGLSLWRKRCPPRCQPRCQPR